MYPNNLIHLTFGYKFIGCNLPNSLQILKYNNNSKTVK